MVDQEAGTTAATESAPDLGWHPVGATPKDPGWYPTGVNPNDQAYWDGQTWTARRQWTVNGWVEQGAVPAAAAASTGPAAAAAPRLSGNPYAPPAYAKPKTTPATVNVGVLLVIISGIALMFGSVGSWVKVTGSVGIAAFHLSINGTDPGISTLISVNGYVTFIGGIVLLVFAGLAMTNDDLLLAILTALVAAATLVFAIYDMFRIVQKISNVTTSPGSSISVGWGLICVLSAAILAMIVTLVRLFSR
ncbi:MAG: hypothetical protein ABSG39_03450 [Acidimicrobiales bacterium]